MCAQSSLLTIQDVPLPCNVTDSLTECTLFACTDGSWMELATYLNKTISQLTCSPYKNLVSNWSKKRAHEVE